MQKEELIKKLAREGAEETVKTMAMAQKMGMINGEADLVELISAGIEAVLEEYVVEIENQSKIILDETGSIRKDS